MVGFRASLESRKRASIAAATPTKEESPSKHIDLIISGSVAAVDSNSCAHCVLNIHKLLDKFTSTLTL